MINSTTRIRDLELCNPAVFGDVVLTCQSPPMHKVISKYVAADFVEMPRHRNRAISENYEKTPENEQRRASILVDQLLLEIYSNLSGHYTDYNSATSTNSKSHRTLSANFDVALAHLQKQNCAELKTLIGYLEGHVLRFGSILVRKLKRRDALRRQRDARSDVITYHLRKRVPDFSPEMRFSIEPLPGDSGFSQWHSAMKMVSQLPEGIPAEFRRRLWLALADRHLSAKGINWSSVERNCFSEWSHPTDSELGVQIVKDLHRTGCSLFCGKDGQENQALLKRVLLAYARWNKAVGYCQGFNMLAALILQVTEKCEADALKLMIYLIEGVLPDSYFADSLRGLSVDMAVFRELLRTKLPRLSRHLDTLQVASKEGTTSYEPPLTNVFTMQWFLTLFCNCLPQPTVLRIWDLILLEGNEILLRTALAIWEVLAERILAARSADEFYCVMGMLMREILEFDLIDANTLIKGIVTIGPLTELSNLREHYLYNINPWGGSLPVVDKDRRMKLYHKDRLVLDIGVLKKQYTKLKERQRQAHIIFNTAVARQTSTRRPAPVAMNHLLLGKSALVPTKRLGPPKGAIPPARQPKPPKTLHWKDTKRDSSSSSSDTELCDDPDNASDEDDEAKCNQLPDDNLIINTASDIDNTFTKASDTDVSANKLLLDLECKIDEDLVDINVSQHLDDLDTTKSDIFDLETKTTTTSDLFDVNEFKIDRSNSLPTSEDGFDFEKFLEDRVRTLKENSFPSEESLEDTSEQDRIKYARKNSIRALEIIQENSLILHRILQCQSRLTPSPPLVIDGDDDDTDKLDSDLEYNPEDQDTTPTNNFTLSNVFEQDPEHQNVPENNTPREMEFPCSSVFTDTTRISPICSPLVETETSVSNNTIQPNGELILDTIQSDDCNYEPISKEITSKQSDTNIANDFLCSYKSILEENTSKKSDECNYESILEENTSKKSDECNYESISEENTLTKSGSNNSNNFVCKYPSILEENLSKKSDVIESKNESNSKEIISTKSEFNNSNDLLCNYQSILEENTSKKSDDFECNYETISEEITSTKSEFNNSNDFLYNYQSILEENTSKKSDDLRCNYKPISEEIISIISKTSGSNESNDFLSNYKPMAEEMSSKKSDYNLDKYGFDVTSPLSGANKPLDIESKYNDILEYIEEKESDILQENYKLEQYNYKLPDDNDAESKKGALPKTKLIEDDSSLEAYGFQLSSPFQKPGRPKLESFHSFEAKPESIKDLLVDFDLESYCFQTPTILENVGNPKKDLNSFKTRSEASRVTKNKVDSVSNLGLEKYTPPPTNMNVLIDFDLENYSFQTDTPTSTFNDKKSKLGLKLDKFCSVIPPRKLTPIEQSPMYEFECTEPMNDLTQEYNLEKYASEIVSVLSDVETDEVHDDFNLKKNGKLPENCGEVKCSSPELATVQKDKIEDTKIVEHESTTNVDFNGASPKMEEELIKIDKNSKYNSILEYSRNLDEKFNNLIVKSGSPKMQQRFSKNYSLDSPEPERHHEPKISVSYTDFLDTLSKNDYSLDATTRNKSPIEFTNVKYNISPVQETIHVPHDDTDSDIYSTSSNSKSENDSFKTRRSLNRETLGESHNLKSPNRIYNPFPVNISSRQNKEVALRLGLYKK